MDICESFSIVLNTELNATWKGEITDAAHMGLDTTTCNNSNANGSIHSEAWQEKKAITENGRL